jgi:hypothetical protein
MRKRSPTVTSPLTWQMRVVRRRITGTWKLSDSSKAARHVVGFLGIGGLEHRHVREAAPEARILLVLRRGHADVVGHGDDQAAFGAGQGAGHQRVGGDVEADVLHRAEGARAHHGGADGDFQRHLLVHRPFGVEVGIGGEHLQHLGRRRARIGAATFVPASHTARATASLPDIRSRLDAGAGMTAAICPTPMNRKEKEKGEATWMAACGP